MDTQQLTQRIDELIGLGDEALATEWSKKIAGRTKCFLDLEAFYNFRASSISFILKLFGSEHPYYKDFSQLVESAQPSCVKRGKGCLKAIKGEIEKGWLNTAKGLISADIFGDFIEMAEHLLEEGYKDAAVVITGSTLEQHLRTLAEKHGIDLEVEKNGKKIPKKADVINADLVKANVYSKLDQKSVTYWLSIRNDAAHGNYAAYNAEQARLLISAVTEFMGRVSE
ncbi:hypothetical protein [Permianibacter aggregans]|uniref:DUF4145 domain-containing protein n=1 Tax=Permianibacter aggregans TaxID=1510150 RepID=A0A4R6UJP5_9GAMM|nr:hypothetical protein [Permianibacter aggregans]QGX39724.1 hypothetical protein E2H98_08670 [Permianibacter aggregans]TDQ47158.1 hypothetical protein EV696_11186 [Permianibacter aggregans]